MAWSVLQSASATNGGSGNVAVPFTTANLTAGTKLIALVAVSCSSTPFIVSGVSDGTNSFTQLATKISADFATHVGLYALDCPAGDAGTKPTITATIGTNFGASIIVQEVSGLLAGNTTAMLDGTASTATGTASPATTGSYTSAAASEYLICGYGDFGASLTLTTPAGYTADAHNVTGNSLADCAAFYKNSTGGSESASITLSGSASWDTVFAAFKIAVSNPLQVTTTVLPDAVESKAYAAQLQAGGGTPGYTWSISSGSLPAWASLNTSTGVISGTAPGTAGSTSFTVQVTDSASATATQALTLSVDAPVTQALVLETPAWSRIVRQVAASRVMAGAMVSGTTTVTQIGTPAALSGTNRVTASPVTGIWGTGQNRTTGNLLVAVVTATGTTSAGTTAQNTGTTGWTRLTEAGTGTARAAIWIKDAAGGDAAPAFTSTISGTATMTCSLYELAGTAAAASQPATSGTGTATSNTAISVTTSGNVPAAGEFAIGGLAVERGTAGARTFTASGTGYTLSNNDGSTSSTGHGAVIINSSPASGAASTGGATFTSGASSTESGVLVVFANTSTAAAAHLPEIVSAPGRTLVTPVPPPSRVITAVPPPAAAPSAGLQGTGTLATAATQRAGASLTGTGSLIASTGPAYITGLGGTPGAGWFTDQFGAPRLYVADENWALPVNGGEWNGGDWQGDYDAYFASRAAQGFTVLLTAALGDTEFGGSFNNGNTWDGVTPFVTGVNPSSGLNSTYWARIDGLIASAARNGITVNLNIGYTTSIGTSGHCQFGWTTTQCSDWGAALAARYASTPNILWSVGNDYQSTPNDAQFSAMLSGLRGGGDTHVMSLHAAPEMTSRLYSDTNAQEAWGVTNAQYNWVYTYNVTYFVTEYAYSETSHGMSALLPVIHGDGYFYQGTSGAAYSATLDRAMRQDAWWVLSSGGRGFTAGSENIYQWTSTAPAAVTGDWYYAHNTANITALVQSLPGWHQLVPDTSSALVTAGRGTRASGFSSGGGGGQYEPAFTDSYVTASRTPDTGSGSSLALIYLSHGTTITIDQTKMVSGYQAFKVDPVTGTKTSITTGSTYNSTGFGNNSQGDPDWVIVLQAPTVTTISGTAALTGTGFLGTAEIQGAGAALTGAGSVNALPAQRAPATLTGTGSLGTVTIQGSGGTLGGAGSVITAVVLRAPATLGAAGSLGTVITQGAGGGIAGAGSLAAPSALLAPAVLTGTGSLITAVIQGAPTALDAAGFLSAAASVTGASGAALDAAGSLGTAVTQGVTTLLTGTGSLGTVATQGTGGGVTGQGSLATTATQLAPATLTAAGFLGTAATQGAIAQLTAAGFLGTAATQGAIAQLTGTGSFTATTGQGSQIAGQGSLAAPPSILLAPAVLTAAGSLITAVTQGATALLSGTGFLSTAVTLRAPASLIATGSLTASPGQGSQVTGQGSLAAPASTLLAPAALAGIGFLSTASSAQGGGTLTGVGTVSPLVTTLLAPAALAAAGSLTASVTQGAGTAIDGAGSLISLAILRAPAALTAAGSLSATGGPAGAVTLTGTGFLAATSAVSGGAGALLPGTGFLGTVAVLRIITTITAAGSLAGTSAQQAGAALIAAGLLTALGTQHPPQIKGGSTAYGVTEPMQSTAATVGTG